jgi:hypothetical protein
MILHINVISFIYFNDPRITEFTIIIHIVCKSSKTIQTSHYSLLKAFSLFEEIKLEIIGGGILRLGCS